MQFFNKAKREGKLLPSSRSCVSIGMTNWVYELVKRAREEVYRGHGELHEEI